MSSALSSFHRPLKLVLVFGLVFAVAAFGAQFMPGPWYYTLQKPPLNPPNWVFPPVWTALYALMAFAAWRVWDKSGTLRAARTPLRWFGLQLLANGLWSWCFFGLESPGLALVDIAALWPLILMTFLHFKRADRLAALCLVPYLLWVSFAAYLNIAIWWLN